jgi:hypothetical protein
MYRFCLGLFSYLSVAKSIELESPLLVALILVELLHRICTAHLAIVKLDSDFNAPWTTYIPDFCCALLCEFDSYLIL